MLSIFHKTKPFIKKDSFKGFVDFHSHILPGVDDGVKKIEESLEILSKYEEMGVSEVWFTPHIMEDIPNTPEELKEAFQRFQEYYCGTIKLHLSAENMIDNLFLERLESGDLLPYGKNGDELLVETSYFTPPYDFYNTLELIKAKGYYPTLAHPERYMYMQESDYAKLINMGVKFQMNIFSQIALYGKHAQQKAKYLYDKHLYSYSGSDLHSLLVIEKYVR